MLTGFFINTNDSVLFSKTAYYPNDNHDYKNDDKNTNAYTGLKYIAYNFAACKHCA